MLVSQQARSSQRGRQGCPKLSFAELRRPLAEPSKLSDGNRQRLLNLARRLDRIQALGDEYARVELSESAVAALANEKVPVTI